MRVSSFLCTLPNYLSNILYETIHKDFTIPTLEKLTKEWPGGSYIVTKSTPRVPGDRPIMVIGYSKFEEVPRIYCY